MIVDTAAQVESRLGCGVDGTSAVRGAMAESLKIALRANATAA